jgi:hypothetical protein
LCQFCDLFIRNSGDSFSVAIDSKMGLPVPKTELIPDDAKVFTFLLQSQATEWFHRKEWERLRLGISPEQIRLNDEEKRWIEFHMDIRERIDVKKSELERLLHSSIIKNLTRGLEVHGFKISPKREIFKLEGAESGNNNNLQPFCGLGGVVGEGIERATDIMAMFELYLEYVHAEEIKEERKRGPMEERIPKETKPVGQELRALEEIKKVIQSVEGQHDQSKEAGGGSSLERNAVPKVDWQQANETSQGQNRKRIDS